MLKFYKFDLLLTYILFFPPLVHAFTYTSYTIGIILVTISLVPLYLKIFTSGYVKWVTVVLFFILILHSTLAYLHTEFLGFHFNNERFLNYILAGLCLFILSSIFAISMAHNIEHGVFEKNRFKFFSVFAIYSHLIMLSNSSYLKPIVGGIPGWVGLMSEPSSLAYITVVLLFIKFVYSNVQTFLCYLLAAMIFAWMIDSIVVLFSVSFVAMCVTKGFWKVLVAGLLLLLGLFYFALNGTADVSFTLDTMNLTGAVYLSGWERTYLALLQTDLLGFGLNQFGVTGDQGKFYAFILEKLREGGVNRFDGSFIFAKLVGEFGLLALVVTVYLVGFWFRALGVLNKRKLFNYERHKVLLSGFILGYFILFFFRGPGYVCGATVIVLAIMINKKLLFKSVNANKAMSKKPFPKRV